MRRTPFVLTATAAGLAGVLSYHTHSQSFAGFNPAAAHPLAPPKRAQPHQAASQPTTTASSASTTGPGSPTTAVGPVPTPLIARQGIGPLVPYGYGELSVKISLSGGKITSVNVVGLRTDSQYSQSIAQQVIPMLQSEVLQAQSANISGISGASYTSEAFAMSLQGALKHVGA